MQHPHPAVFRTPDGFLLPYAFYDSLDFYAPPIVDYEEYTENMSRPRLTKEQVEILEAQFQAHPKPNSNVKRQLAMQTNLSLPRVSVGLTRAPILCSCCANRDYIELVPKQTRQSQAAAAARGVCPFAKGPEYRRGATGVGEARDQLGLGYTSEVRA